MLPAKLKVGFTLVGPPCNWEGL